MAAIASAAQGGSVELAVPGQVEVVPGVVVVAGRPFLHS
jgi:hypothetical protein